LGFYASEWTHRKEGVQEVVELIEKEYWKDSTSLDLTKSDVVRFRLEVAPSFIIQKHS
jgi:hypothetical protein